MVQKISFDVNKKDVTDYFSASFLPFYEHYTSEFSKSADGLNSYKALCPLHDDTNPSLSIFGDRFRRFNCFGCGKKGDVFQFFAELKGLDVKSDFPKILEGIAADFGINSAGNAPKKTQKKTTKPFKKTKPFEHFELGLPIQRYAYTNEKEKVLYYNVKFAPKDFRQCDPTGTRWTVKNIKPKVPYQLPKVVTAETVLIVEGEKDVASLAKLGLVGSCNVAGAGNWTKDLNRHFKGKDVLLLPDNDDPGRKHMDMVFNNLNGIAKSIKRIELPGLPDGGDVTDWIGTYKNLDEAAERLSIIIDGAKPYEPAKADPARKTGFSAAELMKMELPEPRWAIPDILPEGLNILGGKPKMGKSVLSLNIALAVATGGKALGKIKVEKGPVLYLALEDTKRRLQSRLRAMLTSPTAPDNLHLETEWPNMDNDGLSKLTQRIREIPGLRLLIIDTLKKIRPLQNGRNVNPYDVDYENITAIKRLADEHNIAVLLIHHLRKTESDDTFDDFSGTFGLTGAADGLLAFKRKSGQADAELHIVGRDVDAAEYALKYHPDIWTWELIGKSQDVQSTGDRQEIFNTLKDSDVALTPKQIEKLSGAKYWTVIKGIKALVNDGSIVKAEYGKYRIPAYL